MAPNGIEGWDELIGWFGAEPTFHDAEVVGIALNNRSPTCVVQIHAWRTHTEVDERGFYRRDRHAVVSFIFLEVVQLELRDWMHQNVLFGLSIEPRADGHSLSFDSSFGLDGNIVGKGLRIEFAPIEA